MKSTDPSVNAMTNFLGLKATDEGAVWVRVSDGVEATGRTEWQGEECYEEAYDASCQAGEESEEPATETW